MPVEASFARFGGLLPAATHSRVDVVVVAAAAANQIRTTCTSLPYFIFFRRCFFFLRKNKNPAGFNSAGGEATDSSAIKDRNTFNVHFTMSLNAADGELLVSYQSLASVVSILEASIMVPDTAQGDLYLAGMLGVGVDAVGITYVRSRPTVAPTPAPITPAPTTAAPTSPAPTARALTFPPTPAPAPTPSPTTLSPTDAPSPAPTPGPTQGEHVLNRALNDR